MKLLNTFTFVLILSFKVFYSLQTNVINEKLNLGQDHDALIDYPWPNNGDEHDSGDQCSADEVITKMIDIFTPEDFEEGKQNMKTDIESFNETLKAIIRLQEYSRNVSRKMSEFSKRLNSQLSETLMTIDLPSECLSSLVRIMSAAKNGELWALKCKLLLLLKH